MSISKTTSGKFSRFAVSSVLGTMVALVGFSFVLNQSSYAEDGKTGLAVLKVPDDKTAPQVLERWLKARGFKCELKNKTVIFRTRGVLTNVTTRVYKGELDRLTVAAFYFPKDEFKGKKELSELATKLNAAQNFLRVFIDGDGDLGAAGNMTFFDEFSAQEFDAFMDLFATVVKDHILTKEALKLLK